MAKCTGQRLRAAIGCTSKVRLRSLSAYGTWLLSNGRKLLPEPAHRPAAPCLDRWSRTERTGSGAVQHHAKPRPSRRGSSSYDRRRFVVQAAAATSSVTAAAAGPGSAVLPRVASLIPTSSGAGGAAAAAGSAAMRPAVPGARPPGAPVLLRVYFPTAEANEKGASARISKGVA